jgi:hypothetical protein
MQLLVDDLDPVVLDIELGMILQKLSEITEITNCNKSHDLLHEFNIESFDLLRILIGLAYDL